ncbi:MAG: enoyl-CoA hydratase [Acidobacteriota bacterium]
MSEANKVVVTHAAGVKRITINRADRRNAIDPESIALVTRAVSDAATDESRVLILTGAGDSFCAGADLQDSSSGDFTSKNVTKSLREGVNPLILAMRALPKPIIARVHGHAVGVGCNIALACDILIASEKALFSEIFVKIGLMPDGGGTYFLPREVGYHKAFELMATGDIVGAEEALRLGLVNRVVPVAELDAYVDALAERLAQGPAIALARIKAGLNHGLQSTLAEALDFEAVNQGDCFRSTDFVEGVSAFLQKRKAVFSGK